ncbi:GNAT family N-acetyltransferase [Caldibacillus lycopersici]|uniref:GNAT family N-acetyltransferase n=1 Tax=Perspicuibacillus lycopersici TaxID=1325689 RepID=A0AAE3IYW9_9BACI|nr:GNAT family N-acetyltransferase [Perspicuibacillus lycopersici]MCU9614595.1 GNAT family N-acetyltransferase [Perspicuibacillus lycopersici]
MIQIRDAKIDDLPAMLEIYNYAILNYTATFDINVQTFAERKIWFEKYGGRLPLIVAEEDGEVLGYSCLNHFKEKDAYDRTSELSIYIAPEHHGKGVGSLLMKEIIRRAEQLNYHTVIGVITGGNEASVKLHEKFGFELVGSLKEVGYKFGQWQDVHYYQLIFANKRDGK